MQLFHINQGDSLGRQRVYQEDFWSNFVHCNYKREFAFLVAMNKLHEGASLIWFSCGPLDLVKLGPTLKCCKMFTFAWLNFYIDEGFVSHF